MLAPALRRHVRYRALENLQQGLLHAFTGDVPGNRWVLVLAPDFIDFINIDNAGLRSGHVAIGRLKQLQNDIFHVFAYVTGFCQRGCVDNRERYIQHLGQCVRQQSLAASSWTYEKNV